MFLVEVLDSEELGSCKVQEGFIAVVIQIDLFVDATKAQVVSNNEGIYVIIFRQVIIRKFEYGDLFWIEDVNHPVKRRKMGIFP